MYEPIRSKSVHRMDEDRPDFPHRSREEELDIQLAGHLAALLAVTDELSLGAAADRIATQVARLRGAPPARHAGLTHAAPGRTPPPGPTSSRAAHWSSPPRAPTRRSRSSPPSAWTHTRPRSRTPPRRSPLTARPVSPLRRTGRVPFSPGQGRLPRRPRRTSTVADAAEGAAHCAHPPPPHTQAWFQVRGSWNTCGML